MTPLQRLRKWTMRLPNVWGLGHARIHSSLLLMLFALASLLLIIGGSRTGFTDLLPAALTLPIVWVVSLAVRVAAQQLVLGESSIEMETTVGPTGNLSTDYEYLPPPRMLLYALVGQTASLALVLLGSVVSAALIQADGRVVVAAELLDFNGGWGSDAWASQIIWVNLFITALNLLPTVPFDMRAVLFSIFSFQQRNAHEPLVFRRVAVLVSHLSSFMLGIAVAAVVLSVILRQEIIGWYAAAAAAVYLFVAAQWEASRADDLEEQYMPVLPRKHAAHDSQSGLPHLKFRPTAGGPLATNQPAVEAPLAKATAEAMSNDDIADKPLGDDLHESLDIDEILRKLHHHGSQALSRHEQEALFNASQRLQAKRSRS